jgi:hypothetical protein
VTALARRAELVKLSHLMGRPIDLPLDADELRALRERISAVLFDDARPMLQRVATGSRLLPSSLVARVGEAVFGANLCAQIAGILPVPYALDLAVRMSDPFLAEVSSAIDPRSAGEVVRRIPCDRIVSVAQHLLSRGEYVTAARFVDYLDPDTLNAVIESIPDEVDLLRIGVYVESHERLQALVRQLPASRRRAMIAALRGANAERWLEALTIAEVLDDTWRRTLGDLAVELGDEVLTALLTTVRQHDLWAALIPFALAMSPPARARVAELLRADPDALLANAIRAARASDREPEVRAWLGLDGLATSRAAALTS